MSSGHLHVEARVCGSRVEPNAAVDAEVVAELADDANGDDVNGVVNGVVAAELCDSDSEEDGEEGTSNSEEDGEEGTSMLGRHDYWESVYVKERQNLKEHGDVGEIWFGEDVLDAMLGFILSLVEANPELGSDMPILDVGTGNGVLPVKLAKQGFTHVTGSDYSRAAVQLCADVAMAQGVDGVRFVIDDVLESTLPTRYAMITDKGTLDAIGLSADHVLNRPRYRRAVWDLLEPAGLLVITSCNSTKEELITEFCGSSDQAFKSGTSVAECEEAAQQVPPSQTNSLGIASGKRGDSGETPSDQDSGRETDSGGCHSGLEERVVEGQGAVLWEYVDQVRTYPVFRFGGVEGTRVATVAFRRVG